MALRGTDPESYITEYTLVYEDKMVSEGPRAVSCPRLLRCLHRYHLHPETASAETVYTIVV